MSKIKIKIKNFYLLATCLSFLFLITPSFVEAAVLYLMPQSQIVYQDDSFLVQVMLDSESEEVNAVQGNLSFPPTSLQALDFSKGGSILNLWAEEPSFSNEQGLFSFVGGIPGGFRGQGIIGKITFRVLKQTQPGSPALITFGEDSRVLLNDGKGTPAQLTFLEGSYEISEKPEGLPIVSIPTHPDQNKWYSQNTIHIHWDLIEGAEYSYLLSQDPLAGPDETPDKPEGKLLWVGDMEYPDLEDGIYYFSLKQKLPGEEWSKKVQLRIMIDKRAPEEFKPEIGQDPAVFGGKYFLSFATVDKTSGIDHYEISELDKRNIFKQIFTGEQYEKVRNWKITASPYLLEDQSLESKILVKAVDKARNERIAELTPPKKPFPYWIILLIVLGLVIIIWIARKILIPKP